MTVFFFWSILRLIRFKQKFQDKAIETFRFAFLFVESLSPRRKREFCFVIFNWELTHRKKRAVFEQKILTRLCSHPLFYQPHIWYHKSIFCKKIAPPPSISHKSDRTREHPIYAQNYHQQKNCLLLLALVYPDRQIQYTKNTNTRHFILTQNLACTGKNSHVCSE